MGVDQKFLEQAALLSADEAERLLSRMTGKLPKRLLKDKMSREEALALQLEIEDDRLNEWREKMQSIAEKEASKASKASKGE